MKQYRYLFTIHCLLSLALLSAKADAAPINWPDRTYGILVQGQALSEVLRSFAEDYQLTAEISPLLTDEVNARIPSTRPARFLSKLKEMYAFSWYYDGAKIYFYSASEIRSEVLYLRSIDSPELRDTLVKLNILDGDYYWQEIEGEGLVYVSGTPRMLELVSQTAAVLDSKAKAESYEMRIFKLNHASAADQQRRNSQGGTAVPGVATLLQAAIANTIIDNPNQAGSAVEASNTSVSQTVPGVRGQGLAKPIAPIIDNSSLVSPVIGQFARIYADVRLNAVVVYDHPSRMPMYEQLIKEFDQPVKQVEIAVTIINITTENLDSLGIDWRYSTNNTAFGYGADGTGLPDEGQIGLIAGGTELFLATLTALESEGKATVSSRPRIVTGDNLEAVLDSSTTFYVRVAGEEEVDLFPVSVGAVLRVTPHVVQDGNQKQIRLEVNIQDGNQTGDTVDSIPSVTSTSVSTQAVVNNQEGLLIGGYHYDTETDSSSSVPYISAVPIIGNLFKTESKQVINYSKIFMITPRILEPTSVSSELTR